MDTNKLNNFFQSKIFKGFIFGVAIFLLILFIFKVGMIVGAKKADFSCRWSDNYHRNFGGPKAGFLKGFGDKDFIEANGTVGQVIKVASSTLVIKGRGEIEKVVLINSSTTIKSLEKTIQAGDLKVDDMVVIIGEPNSNGQIEAKLIRVMPKPPVGMQFDAMPKRLKKF